MVNKKAEIIRVHLPPDANCLLSVGEHCLRSRDYVNVVVAGKQPALDYLAIDDAVADCTRGLGIWPWTSNDDGVDPDVVLACAGDNALIPVYTLPEDAAAALAAAARHGEARAQPEWSRAKVTPPPRCDEAAALIAKELEAGDGWLEPEAVDALARCYGLPLVGAVAARTPAEAARVAAEFAGPVALKAVVPGLVHKTDAGAVRLGLTGSTAMLRAARRMKRALRGAGHEPSGLPASRAGHRTDARGSASGPSVLRLNRGINPSRCTFRFPIAVHFSIPVDNRCASCLGLNLGRLPRRRPLALATRMPSRV